MKIAICLTLEFTYKALIETHIFSAINSHFTKISQPFFMNMNPEKTSYFVRLLVEVCLKASRLTSCLTPRSFSIDLSIYN